MPGPPRTHDEYLAAVSPAVRAALEQLRRTIHEATPGAEEVIRYRLPTFRLCGKLLVAYGATSQHCAFYLMSAATIPAHAEALAGYDTGTGTIRFQADDPLPPSLVRDLMATRIAESAHG